MPRPLRDMALATFFFSLMAFQIKILDRIPIWEIVFFRALVTFFLCLLFIRAKGISPWGNNRKVLLLRGLFGTIAMCGVFTTFSKMPLSTASTLTKLAPLFAALVAAFILKERIGWRAWCCYLVAFMGVIVAKGFDPKTEPIYFAIGVGASFSAALAYNCIARLKETEDSQVIMFFFPLVTLPLIAWPAYYTWIHPKSWELGLLLSIGCTVQIAQYFMTRAYQSGQPGRVSIISYFGIVLVLFYDVAYFRVVPTPGTLLGMLLVVLGVAFSVYFRTTVKDDASNVEDRPKSLE